MTVGDITRPDAEGPPNDPILAFYEGRGRDQDGRLLSEVLGLTHCDLEVDHRFIQWLFPIPEKSGFGFFSPTLTESAQSAFRSRPELQERLLESFRFILDFYGLELREEQNLKIEEATAFSYRAREWVTDGNHNFLRISRILRCLEVVGLGEHASAFLTYLEDLYERRAEVIGVRTLNYWRLRASGSGEPLPHE